MTRNAPKPKVELGILDTFVVLNANDHLEDSNILWPRPIKERLKEQKWKKMKRRHNNKFLIVSLVLIYFLVSYAKSVVNLLVAKLGLSYTMVDHGTPVMFAFDVHYVSRAC